MSFNIAHRFGVNSRLFIQIREQGSLRKQTGSRHPFSAAILIDGRTFNNSINMIPVFESCIQWLKYQGSNTLSKDDPVGTLIKGFAFAIR